MKRPTESRPLPENETDLEELVGRTTGPQPWRRLFHMATGLVVAVVLSNSGITRHTAIVVLAGVAVGLYVSDLVRLRIRRANEVFFRVFRHLATPREAGGVASSTWYALGLFLVVALFPMHAAVSGILVLAVADPAASYVGRRWGTRAFLGGTLEGSLVFALAAFGILVPRHAPLVALATAVVAALAERRSRPLDDNVTVPLVTAGVATLLQVLT